MQILLVYSSTEGQTRRIARHVGRSLSAAGHLVEMIPAADARPDDLDEVDRVIALASVHSMRYQIEMAEFLRVAQARLAALPSLFVSVSLSAASSAPEDVAELHEATALLQEATGFAPQEVLHVAGAIRSTDYPFFKSWMARVVARRFGQSFDPAAETELTDYAALDASISNWMQG